MSEATLSLISRESMELLFEGAAYGPIEHTQALGVLLFALDPDRVRLATSSTRFQTAMQKVLRAAEETARVLESCAEHGRDAGGGDAVSAVQLAAWLEAGCRTAAGAAAHALRTALMQRLGPNPWRQPMH